MSFDFQTVVFNKEDNSILISQAGSNSYWSPRTLSEEDNLLDCLYASTLEGIILYEEMTATTWLFVLDDSPDNRNDFRWMTSKQAAAKGRHLDLLLENGGDISVWELEDDLPDNILKFLIEINVAFGRDDSISKERLKQILTAE